MNSRKHINAEAVSYKYIRAVAFNNEQDRHLALRCKSLDRTFDDETRRMRKNHRLLCTELTDIHIRTPSFIGTTFPPFLEPDFIRKRNLETIAREKTEVLRSKSPSELGSDCTDESFQPGTVKRYTGIDVAVTRNVGPTPSQKSDVVKALPDLPFLSKPKPAGITNEQKRSEFLEKVPSNMRLKIERVTRGLTMLDMLDRYRVHRDKELDRKQRLEQERLAEYKKIRQRTPPPRRRRSFRICLKPQIPANYRDHVIKSFESFKSELPEEPANPVKKVKIRQQQGFSKFS